MQGANIKIKKGALIVYRMYDVAQEIDLKLAQSLLLQDQNTQKVKRYQVTKDPLRSIILREAPLTFLGNDEQIRVNISASESQEDWREFKAKLEIKIWDYGVFSLGYRLDLKDKFSWHQLSRLGSILDSNSVIDELAQKKRDELRSQIHTALKQPHLHSVFEDYTTFLMEELEEENGDKAVSIKDPLKVLKIAPVAELLLAEPEKMLSSGTKKTVLESSTQYTKKDLLVLDWNSALVLDFTKEKEYQDYIDMIEFSIAQLLELRIYDQLLDEKLDELYNSMEAKAYTQIDTAVYSRLSDASRQLHVEFSDIFEKVDNSVKTVGDYYLAKVLRTADRKFGFKELKENMLRKVSLLDSISKGYQQKVNGLVEEKRNELGEHNVKISHRLETIVIILILIEVIPTLITHYPDVVGLIRQIINWF